ncbi:MAG: hypothetical protein U9N46_10260 [Euryarchaeota archaeon]|nr:hypothetical protein [Euryarchaeota archaeon]
MRPTRVENVLFPMRNGITASSGSAIFLSHHPTPLTTITALMVFMPPEVEPAVPPMIIPMTEMICAVGVH